MVSAPARAPGPAGARRTRGPGSSLPGRSRPLPAALAPPRGGPDPATYTGAPLPTLPGPPAQKGDESEEGRG